jgi:RNase P/RNase MRP subunit p29
VAVAFSAASVSVQAADKEYQVTGPVVEITKDYIVVQKHEGENWHVAIDKSTKSANVKVGDKVTVYYSMTATEIDAKKAKAEKKEKAK